ncbi:hypothetical protein [Streptomyces sp. NBC_01304]|uniref:hypothetical protein n=1 Tax=Streptomyces sp. NBC_01304 TaxID=2903818 RepID=UPI002E100D5A|nr:hypothetical protein OG430_48870 [Streptomyces sp. NBC_01304]
MHHRPAHLTSADYSDASCTEFTGIMQALVHDCRARLERHAPEGQWRPGGTELLEQLAEADELLDHLSRAISTARSGIRRLDGRAREEFLERTVRQPATPSPL